MEKEKIGITDISSDLTLKDFKWFLKTITYNVEENKVSLEVIMYENLFQHSRNFEFQLEEGVKSISVEEATSLLLETNQFIGSTEKK